MKPFRLAALVLLLPLIGLPVLPEWPQPSQTTVGGLIVQRDNPPRPACPHCAHEWPDERAIAPNGAAAAAVAARAAICPTASA